MRRILAAIAIALTVAPRVNAADKPRLLFPWLQLFQLAGAPTAYREDAAHTDGQYGTFILGVRNDAGGTLCGTTGDYCAFQLDSTGQLRALTAQGGQGTHAQRWMVGLSDGSGFISPATDRSTAAAPFSFRLSDGAAFYDSAKTGQFPAALVVGRLDVNLGAWLGSTAPTVGQKAMVSSVPVVLSSDQAAIPVTQSGTWTVQPGNTANTTPWVVELSQTGSKNDVDVLTLPANATVDLARVAGSATATGNGTAAGSIRVALPTDGTGVVRVQGNAGAALDAANNAAMPANAAAVGLQTATIDASPTAATAGNLRYQLASTEGVAYVQEGGPKRFSCFIQAATVTTQCQAAPAAGLRAYVTSATMSNQAATVQTLDIVFGTGAACVTGTTALTHKVQFGTNATTTSPQSWTMQFQTPLVPTAANAICVRPSAATAFGATLTGYIAP